MPAGTCWHCEGGHDTSEHAACKNCGGDHHTFLCPQIVKASRNTAQRDNAPDPAEVERLMPEALELWIRGFRQVSRKYRSVARAEGSFDSWSDSEFARRVKPDEVLDLSVNLFAAFRKVGDAQSNLCKHNNDGHCKRPKLKPRQEGS